MDIKVNCQNSILINNQIYIDPLRVDGKVKARYIFITHPHWDHFSVEDIKKVATSSTKIICPKSMEGEIEDVFENEIIYVQPEQKYVIDDIGVETFCAYNVNKTFHPKQNGWVGYVLTIDNERIMIVGDSDVTPELRNIKADILLLPIGGHYTMDLVEAAELTNTICPKRVIPTHYGDIVGNDNMGKQFKSLISKDIDCEVQL